MLVLTKHRHVNFFGENSTFKLSCLISQDIKNLASYEKYPKYMFLESI
jgi:hypothetical protein